MSDKDYRTLTANHVGNVLLFAFHENISLKNACRFVGIDPHLATGRQLGYFLNLISETEIFHVSENPSTFRSGADQTLNSHLNLRLADQLESTFDNLSDSDKSRWLQGLVLRKSASHNRQVEHLQKVPLSDNQWIDQETVYKVLSFAIEEIDEWVTLDEAFFLLGADPFSATHDELKTFLEHIVASGQLVLYAPEDHSGAMTDYMPSSLGMKPETVAEEISSQLGRDRLPVLLKYVVRPVS